MSQNKVKTITVTFCADVQNASMNCGDKEGGNDIVLKKGYDNNIRVSGQMVRHALFEKIDELNDNNNFYVSPGDSRNSDIVHDIASDLGGYLAVDEPIIDKKKRVSCVKVTDAMAITESNCYTDLLVCFETYKKYLNIAENKQRTNKDGTKDTTKEHKQAIVYREVSSKDKMVFKLAIEASRVGTWQRWENNRFVYERLIDEDEKLRRNKLFLQATSCLTHFAQQSTKLVNASPSEVFIVMETENRPKGMDYMQMTKIQRDNYLSELIDRGITFFYGNDNLENCDSVYVTYKKALAYLDEHGVA
jgi:CRISPR-associated protein Cst2